MPTTRSRRGDIARAYGAVVPGFVLGYAAGYAAERLASAPHAVDLMVFVVPLMFLLLLLVYRSPDTRVSAVRLAGAFIGWSIFVWQFYLSAGTYGSLYYWVSTTRSPMIVLFSGSLLAATLVAFGLIAADIAWTRLQRMLFRT